MERCEHYQKGSYRNRSYIGAATGRQLLSVPLLKGKHQQLPVTEVRIAYHAPWHTQHWHAIQTAYGKSPFFMHYGPELKTILYHRFDKLYDLNMTLLKWILQEVHASAQLSESASYAQVQAVSVADKRNTIQPKTLFNVPEYEQVFIDRQPFLSNLSALDLLMHLGPSSYQYFIDWITSN